MLNEIELLVALRGESCIIHMKDYEVGEDYVHMVMECGEQDLAQALQRKQVRSLRGVWKAMMEAVSFEQGLTRQERLALRESTKSLNVIFRRLAQQQTDMAEARLADYTLTPKQQLEVAKQLELQKRRHKQGLVSYEVVRLHCGLHPPSPPPLRAQQRPASAMELRRPGDVSTPGHRPAPPRPQSGHPLSR